MNNSACKGGRVSCDRLAPSLPGGGERVRTDDLLRARQALSQLSYTPDRWSRLRKAHPDVFYYKIRIKRLFRSVLVGLDGVEPSTSRLSGVRSNRTELQAQDDSLLNVAKTPSKSASEPIIHFERASFDLSKLNSGIQ